MTYHSTIDSKVSVVQVLCWNDTTVYGWCPLLSTWVCFRRILETGVIVPFAFSFQKTRIRRMSIQAQVYWGLLCNVHLVEIYTKPLFVLTVKDWMPGRSVTSCKDYCIRSKLSSIIQNNRFAVGRVWCHAGRWNYVDFACFDEHVKTIWLRNTFIINPDSPESVMSMSEGRIVGDTGGSELQHMRKDIQEKETHVPSLRWSGSRWSE